MPNNWRRRWDTWRLPLPELAWLQVEVSTFCNAHCGYCPRTVQGSAWVNRHLDMELFHKLAPFLPHIPYVHLQGWGEPLLNPAFFDMVDLVVQSGSRCGTTTNGVLVDTKMAERLVDSGIDIVGFSLTGTGDAHDRFRPGAGITQVLAGIKNLLGARERTGEKKPAVHIAYMLMAEAIDELEGLPDLLSGIPVEEIVVSTLDHIPDSEWEAQRIVADSSVEKQAVKKLEKITEQLSKQGIRVLYRLGVARQETARSETCTEQVHQTLVLGADGGIFPCVFSNLPGAGDREEQRKSCFGNLSEASLSKIWQDEAYQKFRVSFRKGASYGRCRTCPKKTD